MRDDLPDILASGIHDAKNQLFVAESLIAASEARHGIDLKEARYAIDAASSRLFRMLRTYHLLREGGVLAITPTILADVLDEIELAQRDHLAKRQIMLSIDCTVVDECLLDRDLLTDMLNNAIQNAGRFAARNVRLSAQIDNDWLVLRIDDDGPGFAHLPPSSGTGLAVAGRVTQMHRLHGREGSLHLSNDSALGGARFQLRLPQ